MRQEPSFNIKCFDKINNMSAYWLGFLFSDGCVSETTGNRKIVSFKLTDRESVKKFSDFIEYKKEIIVGYTPKGDKEVYTVAVSNEYLFNKLGKYGLVKNKTEILEKPNIPEKFTFSFLCGYFDGDGSISLNTTVNSWKVSIGFGSYNFYKWFNSVLEKYNVIYSVENNRKTPKGNPFYMSCMNGISAKYFLYLCYKDLPYELPLYRKKQKYETLCLEKNLHAPNWQSWEEDIIVNNTVAESFAMIQNDKRNYGWIRSKDAIRKRMETKR